MKGAGLFFLRAIDPTRISRCQKKRPTVKARRGINFATQLVVLAPLVAGDYAVLDVNDAVRVLGDVVFVGDQDDGVAVGLQAVQQGHDFDAGLRVEVAGGFVGEDDRRTCSPARGRWRLAGADRRRVRWACASCGLPCRPLPARLWRAPCALRAGMPA